VLFSYLQFPYYQRGSLRQWLLQNDVALNADAPIAERERRAQEAATLMFDMAHAVHALHSKEIMHRDIKPENCLVTDEVLVFPCLSLQSCIFLIHCFLLSV
jgi:serine/threonine protein kinase